MYAFLDQNDIDNLKLAVDKMKSVDFDAARKMELLLEAYDAQRADDRQIEKYQEAIEALPGWNDADHLQHVNDSAALMSRALDAAQT